MLSKSAAHVPSLRISAWTITTALGAGTAANFAALLEGRSGLVRRPWETVELDTCLGIVDGLEEVVMPAGLERFDCRNNRLARLALEQDGFVDAVRRVSTRYGAKRVGVFLGTSTSGILSSEIAYRSRDPATGALPPGLHYRETHNSYSLCDFVRSWLALQGPGCVVSTACSSGAKVFGVARRMVAAGLIDAAVVGGVDSLCLTTLYGFHSLQLLSTRPCRPFAVDRDGISIGEAGGFFLVESADRPAPGDILLSGVGESCDAHHMSAPHPEGLGARLAIEAALAMAGLSPEAIDYVNLHGTATPSNDAAEALAVTGVLGGRVPCSSTKGHTGHTLGAAGAIEAGICVLALREGLAPGGLCAEANDAPLGVHYLGTNLRQPLRHVMSNSFGFGGTNCTLVFSQAEAS